MFIGDYAPGDTIHFRFTTRRFTTGAPFTLAGTPAIRVYKGSSDVEDDSGITLTADFDSKTGLNLVTIDTSADGTFYSAGGQFDVWISAGTVDSVSVVGQIVGRFTLFSAQADIDAIKAKTDNLPSDPADASVVAGLIAAVETKVETVDTVVDAIKAKTDNLPTDPADASVVAGLIAAVETKVDTVDTVVDAVKAKTDNLPTDPADQSLVIAATDAIVAAIAALNDLSSSAAADAVLDEVVEGSTTLREMLRGFTAALLGKASGLETTEAKYRDLADSKDRITATVDADGNRSAVTLDLS